MNKTQEFKIPVERPKNKINRWTLITKKRQIDLMNEMIKIKRNETNKIESYTAKRNEALNESEKFLAQDIKSFVDFFKSNTQESKKAIAAAESQKNIRLEQTKILDKKKSDNNKMLTNIRRNVDTLSYFNVYKEFLDNVSSKSKKLEKKQYISDENVENKHPNTQKGKLPEIRSPVLSPTSQNIKKGEWNL